MKDRDVLKDAETHRQSASEPKSEEAGVKEEISAVIECLQRHVLCCHNAYLLLKLCHSECVIMSVCALSSMHLSCGGSICIRSLSTNHLSIVRIQ